MEIKFDKRFDLIFGLAYAVNREHNCGFNYAGSFTPEVADEFYKLYKQHITKEFDDYIINKGLLYYDKTVMIANSLNDNYEVVLNSDIENYSSLYPSFNPEQLTKLLKEFVDSSHYDEFYESTKDTREELIGKYKDTLNQYIDINQNILADFYGYNIAPQQVILVFFARGAFGAMLDGNQSYVTGLGCYINGKFVKDIVSTLFHEFSHPYINPLGYKYFKDVDIKALLNYAIENGLQNTYHIPITFLNEYIVRTVQAIHNSKVFDEEFIRLFIERQKAIGYTHIEEVIEIFKNKDKYDSFEEFYKNEIVNYIVELNNRVSTMSKTSML